MTEELTRAITAVEAALAAVRVERQDAPRALSLALSDADNGLQDILSDLRSELVEAEEAAELDQPSERTRRHMLMSDYR